MPTLPFDVRNIRWNTIEGIDHLAYHICAVDETKRIVDILFKFDANSKIALHRHKADYITLVIQGELRIYRADGTLKEIRPVGSYVAGRADGDRLIVTGGADIIGRPGDGRGQLDLALGKRRTADGKRHAGRQNGAPDGFRTQICHGFVTSLKVPAASVLFSLPNAAELSFHCPHPPSWPRGECILIHSPAASGHLRN